MGTEKDIIGAIIFLSTKMSEYITGQNLIIDGVESNLDMKKCKKCLLPETYETIEFDQNGCNIYNSNTNLKKNINWKKREEDLKNLVNKFRGKYDYDCIVPYSGGKDSTFQLYYVTKILNLKPLVIRFNHGFLKKSNKK